MLSLIRMRSAWLSCLIVLLPVVASAAPSSDDELIKEALTYARDGGFDLRVYKNNILGASNFFEAFARSAQRGDRQERLYLAQDTLTEGSEKIRAEQRSLAINDIMVYLQMGVIGGLLKKYGSPGSEGQQGSDLVYSAAVMPAGEMSNMDACALSAALSNFADSLLHSDLDDRDVFAANRVLENLCRDAGLQSCSNIGLDRHQCDGHNVNSIVAEQVVSTVNSFW